MSGVFGYSREAVRVKVQKCGGIAQPEYRKFSVDPQITSFEVLQSIIAKAFDLKGDFTVSYRAIDDYGQETYLSLLSDWDLDAAFLSASEPCLGLQIEPKPFQENAEEWDEAAQVDVDIMPSIRGLEALRLPQLQMQQFQGAGSHSHRSLSQQQHSQQQSQSSSLKMQHRLPGLILNQVERTFSMVQRALNLGEEAPSAPTTAMPPRPPLTDAQFRMFLDPIGQVVQDRELRRVIYYGGIEPSLRKVVWKHILNVYPDGMSGKARMDYMKKKAQEYFSLRDCWKDMVQKNQVTPDLTYVTSMVRKDVLRTDRHHPFYAGNDDNQNIASLFNILTTYALNHPSVSYCQGMSDLASPLLVTMGDEAHAYICFCALMSRLRPNFMLDGMAMTLRFQHLGDGLLYYDPEFYAYLKSRQADDLLFCYRWLLLEMKREFAFDDALRMMEVMWSSLPPVPPYSGKELPLYDVLFMAPPSGLTPPPISPLLKSPRENAYTKVCALRRQGSGASLMIRNRQQHGVPVQRQNQSLDETSSVKGKLHKVKVKPYSSLDDSSLGRGGSSSSELAAEEQSSEANCHQTSRSLRVSSEKDGSSRLSSSVRSHLKEKFQSGRCKNLLLSLDKLDRHHDSIKEESQSKKDESTRVVKNLNEFLNFSNLKRNNSLSPKKNKTNFEKQDRVPSVEDSVFDSNPDLSSLKNCGEQQKNFDSVESTSTSTYDRSTSEDSSPDDSDYFPMTTSMTQELRIELDGLDRQVFGSNPRQSLLSDDTEDTESACSESTHLETESDMSCNHHVEELKVPCRVQQGADDVFVWENPLKASPITPDEQAELEQEEWLHVNKMTSTNDCFRSPKKPAKTEEGNTDLFQSEAASKISDKPNLEVECGSSMDPAVVVTSNTNCEEAIDLSNVRPLPTGNHLTRLPPPTIFGGGNPFLIFLCLTILTQHREFIMRRNFDYNDMAMHFDKMVRKHDVTRVLNQARLMYAAYLKQYNNNNISAGSEERKKENAENLAGGLKV
ncbi:hypothetical protein ONE63_004205 [Megalurothrips usitatus]|uniref:Rab-GAP TBC domain-containing protein n=1 Tax=Megalurothrips usitatus TaxID=439358 RepID=A0AAV7X235_9NEOP|nr:hypothetical protein ONE63_004205 [Megalurothrips usitatus]